MKKTQETKEVKLTGTEVVVQSNTLVDFPKKLDLQEQKLFLFLVSKIDPYDEQQQMCFKITVNDFAKAIGLNNHNSLATAYRDVRKVVRSLQQKIVTEVTQGKRGPIVTDMPLITYAQYCVGEGYAELEINPHLATLLFELHEEFTQYKLSNVINLSSTYAIRLYELLKKQETIGQRTFLLEDLRKKLGVHNNTLKQFAHFRRIVLEIAQREINKNTDIEIDYTFKKTGRKITHVICDIKSKDHNREQDKKLYNEHKENRQMKQLTNQIMEFGFNRKEAKTVLENAEPTHISNAIQAVKKQTKKGNAQAPKAMIKTAIKEKWEDKESKKTKKNSTQKKQKRKGFYLSKILNLFKWKD